MSLEPFYGRPDMIVLVICVSIFASAVCFSGCHSVCGGSLYQALYKALFIGLSIGAPIRYLARVSLWSQTVFKSELFDSPTKKFSLQLT